MGDQTGLPDGLGSGGSTLWAAFAIDSMPAAQVALLIEACRAKDRLDRLDLVLRGESETWMVLTHRVQTQDYELKIDDALAKANATASSLRMLLAALPAEALKRPQVKNALDELTNRRSARGADAARSARPAVKVKRS